MNKNVIVTMIAGALFAASAVGPAFAGDGSAPRIAAPNAESVVQQSPDFDLGEALPDLEIEDRLRNAGTFAEKLKNLDLEAVLGKAGAPKPAAPVTLPDLAPVEIPEVDMSPEIEPLEPPELPDRPEPGAVPDVPQDEPQNVPRSEPGELPEVEADVEAETAEKGARANSHGAQVKGFVSETKAEKAAILASYGGDRRAAKAELKAAQRRMVERIKSNKGGGPKR